MSTDFDYTKPTSGSSPKDGDDWIRANATGLSQILALDHQMASNPFNADNKDGEHKQVTLYAPLAADPDPGANKGAIYTKDVSAKAELHFEDEDSNVLQLTSGGKLNGAILLADSVDQDAVQLDHDGWLTGAGHTSGSVNLIRATGDAGSEVAQIPDGAQTATDAAPTDDKGVANKKYVDDAIPAQFTPSSYAAEESVILPNGLIMKFGSVTSGAGVTDITFAAAFPTAIITAVVSSLGDGELYYSYGLRAMSTSKLTVYRGLANKCNWIAIGY